MSQGTKPRVITRKYSFFSASGSKSNPALVNKTTSATFLKSINIYFINNNGLLL